MAKLSETFTTNSKTPNNISISKVTTPKPPQKPIPYMPARRISITIIYKYLRKTRLKELQ